MMIGKPSVGRSRQDLRQGYQGLAAADIGLVRARGVSQSTHGLQPQNGCDCRVSEGVPAAGLMVLTEVPMVSNSDLETSADDSHRNLLSQNAGDHKWCNRLGAGALTQRKELCV